jgi:hypothetical protein
LLCICVKKIYLPKQVIHVLEKFSQVFSRFSSLHDFVHNRPVESLPTFAMPLTHVVVAANVDVFPTALSYKS